MRTEYNVVTGQSVELPDAEVIPYIPTIAELKAAKQAQIDAIEAKAYMRRGQRETWLLNVTEKYTSAGYTHAQVYVANPEYKRTYDENVLATQLRTELKAIV